MLSAPDHLAYYNLDPVQSNFPILVLLYGYPGAFCRSVLMATFHQRDLPKMHSS